MPPRGRGRGRGVPQTRQNQPSPGPGQQSGNNAAPIEPPRAAGLPPAGFSQGRQQPQTGNNAAPIEPPRAAGLPPAGFSQGRQQPQTGRREVFERPASPPPGYNKQQHPGAAAEPTASTKAPSPANKKEKFVPVDPQDVGLTLEHKSEIEPELPRDPGPGKLGMKIKLKSNHYKLKLPTGNVFHYDVEISSKRKSQTSGETKKDRYRCLNTKRNREVVNYMIKTVKIFKGVSAVYDGKKNLYTRTPLALVQKVTFPVEMPDEYPNPDGPPRTDSFEVDVQPVEKKGTNGCDINLDIMQGLFDGRVSSVPRETYMALETILRNSACQRFIPIGRNFYYPPNPRELHPLGGGREIWFGYHQSIRLGQWGPTVNLDTSATVFYEKKPILEYVAELMRCRVSDLDNRVINDSDLRRITKELKTKQVEVTHLRYKRKYRVLKVTRERADRLEIQITVNEVNQRTTVANYFSQNYKPLQFPHLPCLQVAPQNKNIYLPIEVCNMVEGQHCKAKLEEKQNAEMIKFTARAPDSRFREIADLRRRADYEEDEFLNAFGMSVDKNPLLLEGRVLESPNLRYQSPKSNEVVEYQKIKPRDGQWDMRGAKYFKGAVINTWVLLSFSDPRFCPWPALENFAKMICRVGNEQGITINRPANIDIVDRRTNAINALTGIRNKFKPDLILCVVPTNPKTTYGEIKHVSETVLGLSTQCVKDKNVSNCKPALVSNLCQKINAKVGGINNSLTPGEPPSILNRPVIIIGADVTHPGPTSDGEVKPSIAAVVGSLDGHPSRYAVSIRAQRNIDTKKKAIENILDLKEMVMELLKAFYRSTGGKKPEKIIFYRDGVSEGQFGIVKDLEVTAIRQACRSLGADYEPGITFVVVQKRHHTRFMTQDPRQGVGKMRNIPPGTTVDTAVTHPLNFDFFLCSHFGLQGTSRPGHYTVIEDDNNFTQDDLQKLTYYLCHTYARCTKSISVPAPVNYAHLAAYRARLHLSTQYDESSGSDSTSVSDFDRELPNVVFEAIKVQELHKSSMYFV